jgi:hypothetical protein
MVLNNSSTNANMSSLPWPVGQKVVCVDDQFRSPAIEYFTGLPRKGRVYTVKDVFWGYQWGTETQCLSVRLVEIQPIDSDVSPGFSLWRFRLLEDVKLENELSAVGVEALGA